MSWFNFNGLIATRQQQTAMQMHGYDIIGAVLEGRAKGCSESINLRCISLDLRVFRSNALRNEHVGRCCGRYFRQAQWVPSA